MSLKRSMVLFSRSVCLFALLWPAVLKGASLGTAFTYQGHLVKTGTPVTDTCDMTFGLWDAASGGSEVGASPQGPIAVDVVDGIFSVSLDFGDVSIDGTARWLEISVLCPGDAMATTLAPLVELTPAPHALALPGLYTQQNATSPNLIGGYSGNQVSVGVVGATIGGGGRADDGAGSPDENVVSDNYGTIGGGRGNRAGDSAGTVDDRPYATVAGGFVNRATARGASVVGGEVNWANQVYSFIGGGGFNTAAGNYSTVGGGNSNDASGDYSTIAGGLDNHTSATWSSIGGGISNLASGLASAVPGGYQCVAAGNYSLASGRRAKANHHGSFVWGGATDADFASTAVDQFLIRAPGGVGIGTTAPMRPLHVAGDAQVDGTMWASTLSSNSPLALQTAGTTRIFADDVTGNVGVGTVTPNEPLHVAGSAQIDGTTRTSIVAGGSTLDLQTSGGTRIFLDDATGNVGVGTITPTEPLHVAGDAKVDGTMWASTVSSNSPLALQTAGTTRIFADDVTGRVGVGTTMPLAGLDVVAASGTALRSQSSAGIGVNGRGTNYGGYFENTGISGFRVGSSSTAFDVGVEGFSSPTGFAGVVGMGAQYGGYFTNNGSAGTRYGVFGSATNYGVYGTGGDYGVYGSSGLYGVYGSSSSNYGVFGSSGGFAGVYGAGSQNGVYGSSSTYGVYGQTFSTTGGVGVWGRTMGTGGTAFAVYGLANPGQPHWAGYFSGAVHVAGTLSKAAGAFKIDHPLDPANKYLSHSFVESPDMKNIYDGTVALDGRGEAWIALPSYFEALNRDFRYQLTAIGGAAPNLHVAQEISGNKFKIAGGPPQAKVSWQVTGIRHDPYAEANRIQVEEDKQLDERGKYLTPEVYGKPVEMSLHQMTTSNEQRLPELPVHEVKADPYKEGGRQ